MKEGILIGSGITELFALLIWASYKDKQSWQEYTRIHHCIAVGKKEATNGFGTGVDSNGNAVTTVTYNPSQTIYHCDGGEIEIR